MRTVTKTTDEFIFLAGRQVIDRQELEPDEVEEHARNLAQRHRCKIMVAVVVFYEIGPNGTQIPFQGEPMSGPPERTAKEIYGL